MYHTLTVTKHPGFAILSLNRPEALNALSRALRDEFSLAVAELNADPDVRVLILTGQGRAFCAGLDLKELGDSGVPEVGGHVSDPIQALNRFEGPVIGAVNGAAITGGFELALACDVLLAAQSARFADTHARVGVLPGWGLSQRLCRLIGEYRAKEMAFTGRYLSAEQAECWGIVNRVVADESLMDDAIEMAQSMLSMAPNMIEQLKALINDGLQLSFGDALTLEGERSKAFNSAIAPSDLADRREGVRSVGQSMKQ